MSSPAYFDPSGLVKSTASFAPLPLVRQSVAASPTSPASSGEAPAFQSCGVTPRGTFACDARIFCAVGEVVWVAERSGVITVRSGRNGELRHTLDLKEKVIGTSMLVVDDEVWIGTNSGKIMCFDATSYALRIELTNPEAQSQSDVHALVYDGICVFAAMAACRAGQWVAKTKQFVRSYLRQAPVLSLAVHNSVLYLGDADGAVSVWDVKSGEVIASVKDSRGEVLCLIAEPTSHTLWLGRSDGSVDVYSFQPSLVRIESLRQVGRGKITSLLAIGGKVWAGGYDRTIFVYHAQTRTLVGSFKGDHSSFIFTLGKVFTLETARVWTIANGGKIHMYDGEGFFTALRGHSDVADEVSACYTKIQQLRMQLAHAEVEISTERDKIMQRDLEITRLREESQDRLLRIHSLEHAVETKDGAIGDQGTQRAKLLDELQKLTKKSGDQTVQINLLEKEKMNLRGDIARLQDELNRGRAQFSEKAAQFIAMEQERSSLANEKQRLLSQIQLKEKDLQSALEDARKAKDALAAKNADIARKEHDVATSGELSSQLRAERDAAVDQAKRSDDAKKRLEDTILLKEVETKDLLQQLTQSNAKYLSLERDYHELQRQREEDVRSRQRLHDSHVLRNHEYDVLRQEKDGLQQQLDFEKQQTHTARDSETKMRLQMEELKRQLETETNNVKMLRDQYTIFQFVINSRGELVSQLWTLFNKGVQSIKVLQELETNIRTTDPLSMDRLTLKREWKSAVVDRVRNACAAVADFQKLAEYIVANYFSEYEKLHLGVSTSKFQPDTQRPTVVGDQLLTKLRDVTLIKQYHSPTSSKIPKPLPPPYDASFGSHHSIHSPSLQQPAPLDASSAAPIPLAPMANASPYFYGPSNVSNISATH